MTAVSIAKFTALTHTNVAEQIETTWEAWLDFLTQEPAEDFSGQMDHGGWSPVLYDPPRRAKDNVRRVFALVLDHDQGGDWGRIAALWSLSQGAIYTTKSHSAEVTRLRVVLPLSRPVSVEEYAKIWDWAAVRSHECPPDPQCKDASRFWYDPSMPPGGWRAERLTGKPIDPDAVLALTPIAAPRLNRPVGPVRADERMKRAAAYLAKIPGAVQGSGGSTVTFNAVAHVMIGFDLSQEDTEALISTDYNPRCSPPWSAKEIQHKVASVAKTCKRSRGYLLTDRPRIDGSRSAAAYAPAASSELEVDWRTQLLTKKDFSPKRAYHNTAVFVRLFPDYRGKWSVDTMTMQPWFEDKPMHDTLVHEIRAHADRVLGYTPSTPDVEAAILTAAQDRAFHPIQQYLRSVDWDGVPRLHGMARDFLGSDVPLHAEMVRRFMIGAAARALWPGSKLDTALMLVGEQGIGKSTFFSILGGPWHSDSYIDITNKDSFVQIHSAWIYELSELENVVGGRAESRLKAWLTSTHDNYRAPYARTPLRRPRAVVICGTTNREQFLTDDTGSRRFWIVPCGGEIPRELLTELRDQLWAEAVSAAEAGEPWWLTRELDAERDLANREHLEDDAWTGLIADWLAPPSQLETTVAEVLQEALKVDPARQDRWSQMRVSRALKELGWRKIREARPPRRWRYIRGNMQLELQS